ncbi:hypothetical protein [Neptuniibacter sp.]|uniref:hypothetical protein n=1 Tax=Neptuniibacter sp. TaxID=1962643 RepID=UPI002628C6F3|nr:hypothetical protein [Neptuniibacter sp.]MCP4595768.1 hypothetical protein [Neptuniibacter sp.]
MNNISLSADVRPLPKRTTAKIINFPVRANASAMGLIKEYRELRAACSHAVGEEFEQKGKLMNKHVDRMIAYGLRLVGEKTKEEASLHSFAKKMENAEQLAGPSYFIACVEASFELLQA